MQVDVEITLHFPARSVWTLAGGFDLLPSISTGTTSSRLEDGGRIRVLVNRDGSVLWERLLDFDEHRRTLSYAITDAKGFKGAYGPGYRGRVTISEVDARSSIFRYSAEFEPAETYTEETARLAVRAFAEDCARGIARVLSRADSP
jgi:Polyketide cyclase / dehydrase and lipid transport